MNIEFQTYEVLKFIIVPGDRGGYLIIILYYYLNFFRVILVIICIFMRIVKYME